MYQEYLNQLQASIAPLSIDQLKDLLNDDDKLDEKIEETLQPLTTTKQDLLAENRIKAEKNIEKEPQIMELRTSIQDLGAEGKQLCEEVQKKLADVKEKKGDASHETALALLQTAAAECEEESEELFRQFKSDEINIENFLEKFLASRKTMHLRKFKAEKMQELIRQDSNPLNQGTYPNLPGRFFYPAAPYPAMPSMPMPRF